MNKITDFKGDAACDFLCKIIDPMQEIAKDKSFIRLMKAGKAIEAAKKALKEHKESTLKIVCAFAICLAASVGSIAVTIATIGLLNININIIDPNTLNVKCIIAALLAFLLAPILEINEVTHVPIFSPYSIGNAAVIGINP